MIIYYYSLFVVNFKLNHLKYSTYNFNTITVHFNYHFLLLSYYHYYSIIIITTTIIMRDAIIAIVDLLKQLKNNLAELSLVSASVIT